MQDKKDYHGALAALGRIPAPADSDRTRMRYDMDRADALAGAGQKDSARVILTALAARFPHEQAHQGQARQAQVERLQPRATRVARGLHEFLPEAVLLAHFELADIQLRVPRDLLRVLREVRALEPAREEQLVRV